MIEQSFKAVDQTQAELHSLKVEKLDVCVRPLFSNSVTYIYYVCIRSQSELQSPLCYHSYIVTGAVRLARSLMSPVWGPYMCAHLVVGDTTTRGVAGMYIPV